MRYAFFPGCSLGHTASAYADSALAVARVLGLDLDEIPDWNCCGANEFIAEELLPAYALVARNLALVPPDQGQVVAPCSLCHLNLARVEQFLREDDTLRERVNEALGTAGLSYRPRGLQIRHLLDVLVHDVGPARLASLVLRPLRGLRLAPYYGCLLVRPIGSEEDPEDPRSLDLLLQTLGAEVVDYPLKSACCGGHMTQIQAHEAYALLRALLAEASSREADAIVTACPMCQLNLDAYQEQVNEFFGTHYEIPVLFFTQLLGLAFGLDPKELGFGKEVVKADAVLRPPPAREVPPSSPGRRRRPSRRERGVRLPMPSRRSIGGAVPALVGEGSTRDAQPPHATQRGGRTRPGSPPAGPSDPPGG